MKDLKSFIEIVTEHGDVDSDEYPFETSDPEAFIAKAKTEWDGIGPVDKIAVVWHVARGHMTSEVPRVVRDSNEAEGALHVLAQGIRHLNAHFLVSRVMGDEEPSPTQLLGLYRLWPSLKLAYERFQTMNPGPMTGWVFINPEAGLDLPASSDIGTSFHKSLDDVKELVREWVRESEQHQDVWDAEQREVFRKLVVRKVTVSAEKGLEYLPGEPVPVMSLV